MNCFAEKRARFILALVLVGVVCAWAIIAALPTPINYRSDNPLIKGEGATMMIAHRGGGDEFPENTLEAFYNAYSIDENVIMETDVNLTKDGVLILLHNELLDATTNVTGRVSDWNYSDLIKERVDFGYDNPTEDTVLSGDREHFTVDGQRRLPTDVAYPDGVEPRDEEIYFATTFEELITAFDDNIISVEIKPKGELGVRAAKEAVRIVEKHDAFDRVIFTCFWSEVSREFKRMQREKVVPDSFMYSPGIADIVKYYSSLVLRTDALFKNEVAVIQLPMEELGFNFATRRLIENAHKRNLAVQYWTIDDEDDMRALIELGADAIMTDNPSVLKRVLDEYKQA